MAINNNINININRNRKQNKKRKEILEIPQKNLHRKRILKC